MELGEKERKRIFTFGYSFYILRIVLTLNRKRERAVNKKVGKARRIQRMKDVIIVIILSSISANSKATTTIPALVTHLQINLLPHMHFNFRKFSIDWYTHHNATQSN